MELIFTVHSFCLFNFCVLSLSLSLSLSPTQVYLLLEIGFHHPGTQRTCWPFLGYKAGNSFLFCCKWVPWIGWEYWRLWAATYYFWLGNWCRDCKLKRSKLDIILGTYFHLLTLSAFTKMRYTDTILHEYWERRRRVVVIVLS